MQVLAYNISDWLLSGAPYRVGVSLYSLAFPMRPKLRIYQGQLTKAFVDPRLYDQLKNELRVLAKARPQEEIDERAKLPVVQSTSTVEAPARSTQEDIPESVYALRRQARGWHKRFDAARADLRHTAALDIPKTEKETKLRIIAKELMTVIQPELDAIYKQLKAFAKTGEAPPHPDLEAMRNEIAAEVCEYERLHNYAKRNELSDELQARLSELRKKYNSIRENSYKKIK